MTQDYCASCGKKKSTHIFSFIEICVDRLFPFGKQSSGMSYVMSRIAESLLITLGIARYRTSISKNNVLQRTWYFVEAIKKKGAVCEVLYILGIPTNYIKISMHNKIYRYEIFYCAEEYNGEYAYLVDDKWETKKYLQKHAVATPPGRLFYIWQKHKAVTYGERLGYPLVVKPLGGSVSRHVTTRISNKEELMKAINFAHTLSPCSIIESYIENTSLYRVTVIDKEEVFITKELPANVVGDGTHSIEELVTIKNAGIRSAMHLKEKLLQPVTVTETTNTLLRAHHKHLGSIPKKDERVFLQYDPFPLLGYDLEEVTGSTHPDIITMCKKSAACFGINVVGIDILIQDHTKPLSNTNPYYVIELNSAPCIELHHSPTYGTPTYPADAMVRMFFKYNK